MNLYSKQPRPFPSEAIKSAQAYARQASRALNWAVQLVRRKDDEIDATKVRTVINIVIGMIMGQNRCSQSKAAQILKSASSSRNVKLLDIASARVAALGIEPATAHFDR